MCSYVQQSPGSSGSYPMSCRVYAAAAAAAYRQRPGGGGVADVGGGGLVNYGGRSCQEAAAAATTFCGAPGNSAVLGGGYCGAGPFSYGYPTYGATYGVDGGARLCSSTTEFVDIGDMSDFTARYLPCVGDRGGPFGGTEHRSDLPLCAGSEGRGFVPPLTQSSSSSSAALVELNDFVSRGDRLMQNGETPTPAPCSRLSGVSEQDRRQWHAPDSPTTETSITTTTTTTKWPSCLYSAAAAAAKSAFTKTNTATVRDAAVLFPRSDNPFQTSTTTTCDKAKSSSSGNNRTHHIGVCMTPNL